MTATNPECAKTCIETGAAPVFISEQARGVFIVKGDRSVVEDLGFHVEVKATVDERPNTIVVEQVKHLGDAGAACTRPRKSK